MHDLSQHAEDCALAMTEAGKKHLKSLKGLDLEELIAIHIAATRACFDSCLKAAVDMSIDDDMPDIIKYDMVDKVMKMYDPTELRHELIKLAFGGKK